MGTRPVLLRGRGSEAAVLLTAAAVSVLAALSLTRSPQDTALAVLAVVALSLAVLRPALLFAVAIALLALEPAKILHDGSTLAHAGTFKLMLYAGVLPLVFDRGLDPRKTGPLLAYALVAFLSDAFGTRLPGLTASETAASLATLALGWVIFAVRWKWRRDQLLLKVVALVPALSLLAGIALQEAGRVSLLRHGSPPRLEGATIPPWLATFALCGVLACLILARRERWRWSGALGALNALVLCATLTRGALLALLILMAPSLVVFWRMQARRGGGGVAKLVALLAAVTVGVVLLLPGIQARNEDASVLVAGRGSHEIASGRFRAWSFAYERAKVNLVFGRGVGAGPIVGRTAGGPTGFVAQHNEYLRMLLEVGVVGALILLLTIACTLAGVIGRAPSVVRPQLTAAALAFGVYSITENTLSATPLAAAFLLVLSLGASSARPPVVPEIAARGHALSARSRRRFRRAPGVGWEEV